MENVMIINTESIPTQAARETRESEQQVPMLSAQPQKMQKLKKLQRLQRLQKLQEIPKDIRNGTCRVAAYCRVSTDTDGQKGSFESQVKTYTDMVRSRPGWELVGVYADEGLSGTRAEGRPDFLRLIRDCEDGKIDLIVTKSISRFARNTSECLDYMRHLQDIGVNIIFENDNIDTRTKFSEIILTILAAFAQEESHSISENTKWGIRKRFEEGISRWCNIYGYTRREKDDGSFEEYVVVPEEAIAVQTIFKMYEQGEGIAQILKLLEDNMIASPSGNERWSGNVIYKVLDNEKYAGDILMQKYIIKDHISHKAITNPRTEVAAYYLHNHHKPIVDRKTFENVKAIRSLKNPKSLELMYGESEDVSGVPDVRYSQYPFGEMLRCPCCGRPLYQNTLPVQEKNGSAGWFCGIGEDACRDFIIRSSFVEGAVLKAYEVADVDVIAKKITAGKTEKVRRAAEKFYKMKSEKPEMDSVEYYWIAELISKIEIGGHSRNQTELSRMKTRGEEFTDDRVVTVYWKAGLKTMVPSGVLKDCDDPKHVAGLYRAYLDRRVKRREKRKLEAEAQANMKTTAQVNMGTTD